MLSAVLGGGVGVRSVERRSVMERTFGKIWGGRLHRHRGIDYKNHTQVRRPVHLGLGCLSFSLAGSSGWVGSLCAVLMASCSCDGG